MVLAVDSKCPLHNMQPLLLHFVSLVLAASSVSATRTVFSVQLTFTRLVLVILSLRANHRLSLSTALSKAMALLFASPLPTS